MKFEDITNERLAAVMSTRSQNLIDRARAEIAADFEDPEAGASDMRAVVELGALADHLGVPLSTRNPVNPFLRSHYPADLAIREFEASPRSLLDLIDRSVSMELPETTVGITDFCRVVSDRASRLLHRGRKNMVTGALGYHSAAYDFRVVCELFMLASYFGGVLRGVWLPIPPEAIISYPAFAESVSGFEAMPGETDVFRQLAKL